MSFHSYHHPSCNQSKPINQSIIIIYRRTMQKDKRQFNKIKKNIQAVNSKRWNNQNQFISHIIISINAITYAMQRKHAINLITKGKGKERNHNPLDNTPFPPHDFLDTTSPILSLSFALWASLFASSRNCKRLRMRFRRLCTVANGDWAWARCPCPCLCPHHDKGLKRRWRRERGKLNTLLVLFRAMVLRFRAGS